MKITFLLPGRPVEPVGGYRVVYQYANGLVARGHDVEIVHPRRLRQHPSKPPLHPVAFAHFARLWARVTARRALRLDRRITWHPMDPRVRLRFTPSLEASHVRAADAVVATAWETAEYAAELPRDRGVGFYLIQHHETWSGSAERVDATWRLPLRKIVIARWLEEHARALGLDDVIHIPNAIDLDRFTVTSRLEDRPPRVAMLYSTWHQWKGTTVGIEALRLAKSDFPDLEAVLFGINEAPDGTPDWVVTKKQPSQDELVADIYNGSRIYLCPSFAEGWHLPPAEAMACGCALVSTDIGGVKDYAEQGVNALLCPVNDAQALADAILTLLRSDDQRLALARASVETMGRFSWDRSTDALERYLRDGVSDSGRS